ncbi:MAG: helix-turn-helix domain-containing protein [Verrucomicrobia bacterium]|nr:helix-turn-helix domain-containing protein [Verrucomicrobiota bacterium]
MRLIAQHEHTVDEIMKIAGVSRHTVFTHRDTVVERGLEGLLEHKWKERASRRFQVPWPRIYSRR